MRRGSGVVFAVWVGLFACAIAPRAPSPAARAADVAAPIEVASDLQVSRLRPGVWLHTSWQRLADGSRFPSNGLLLERDDHLLLIDTAWGEAPTERLLGWAEGRLGKRVTLAILTHFHDDRAGGAAVLARRGVRMAAHPLTRELLSPGGGALPDPLGELVDAGGAVALDGLEIFYAGPAHTRDNVVVWLPKERILFGGCAVKSLAAQGMGNVADADLASWPDAARRARARYANAELVVPGHGDPGGPELLDHTLRLLDAAK